MATFSTLYNETLRRVVLDLTSDATQVTQAKLWVNNSQRDIQMMRRWNSLFNITSFTTTDGTSEYTLAARSVPGTLWHEENGIPQEIFAITHKEWIGAQRNVTTEGKPELYFPTVITPSSQVNTITVKLWPIPDSSAYTIYDSYYAIAVDMATDSSVPIFPQEFDELIILMGTYMGKRARSDHNGAQLIKRDVQEEVQRLKKWDDDLVPNFSALKKRSIYRRPRSEEDSFNFPIS